MTLTCRDSRVSFLIKLSAIAVFGIVVASPAVVAASAAVAPGVTGAMVVDPGNFVGTEIADTGLLAFATPASSGSVEELVYAEASGSLDFYYQISNSSTSLLAIDQIASTNFTAVNVGVAFVAVPNGIEPVSANRSSGGDTVGFALTNPTVGPGHLSDWLEISTNATFFALNGTSTIVDGNGDSAAVDTYSPAAVPEPAAASLLAGGVVSLALVIWRRRAANAKLFL